MYVRDSGFPHPLPVPAYSDAALAVLHEGNILADDESPEDMVERVVTSILQVERRFGTSSRDLSSLEYEFADCMAQKLVTLGSPILTNAGRSDHRALGSCVAIPVDLRQSFEHIRPIIEAYYEQNMGSGFDLSDVSEPMAVLDQLNRHAEAETAASKYERYIGNMANLDIDHPCVRAFAGLKAAGKNLPHFNLSINMSDAFMHALMQGEPFNLRDGSPVDPAELWRDIGRSAWQCGDPGLLFMDRFNADNPTPTIGRYRTTAPCAEVGLAPGESCVFGYVNLGRLLTADPVGKLVFDFDRLDHVVTLLTRVLDDALEVSLSRYPDPASQMVMSSKRKIGIGICGFADLLVRLRLPYDSPDAIDLLQNILVSISFCSKMASVELARQRGSFPAFPVSRYVTDKQFLTRKYGITEGLRVSAGQWHELAERIRTSRLLRHAVTTALPPSGRSALILDASTSLEPWFSLFDGQGALKPDVVSLIGEECGVAASAVLTQVEAHGTCQLPASVPTSVRATVKRALEVSPQAHLAIVSAASKCVDEAASKTINLPSQASADTVLNIYFMAWQAGLKAISVYRNGSKVAQPESFERTKAQ